jgi:hypothetical protein
MTAPREESCVSHPAASRPSTPIRASARSIARRWRVAAGSLILAGLLVPGVGPIAAPGAVAAAVPACSATQLSARIVDWQGAAGSRIADVVIVNTSFAKCSLRDFPRVVMVSARAKAMMSGKLASTTAHTHGLGPLAFLKTEVSASNYCGPAYAKPVTLAFVLPGTAGGVVAIPLSPTDDSGVPPCNGAPGSAGQISMHAWHA